MRPTEASHTAVRVAAHRARHQLLDHPKVFEDGCAVAILGPEAADQVRAEDDGRSRAMRAFVVARSRYAEDQLADAVTRGVRQYVVLGAGLDTFAYRNPWADLRVWELDHPATQAFKRERLAASGISVPPSVRFTSVDFQHETTAEVLARAGLDPTRPAYFSWLGVTPYIEPAATYATLRAIASFPAGSGVTFDYALERDLLGEAARASFDALAARVAAVGEPFRGLFRPDAWAEDLRGMGFVRVLDVPPGALNARYFASRADGLCHRGSAHVATAWT